MGGRTYSGVRVDRASVYVKIILGQYFWALINRSTRAVEDAAEHVLRHAELQAVSSELNFGLKWSAPADGGRCEQRTCLLYVDTRSALENLDHRAVAWTEVH